MFALTKTPITKPIECEAAWVSGHIESIRVTILDRIGTYFDELESNNRVEVVCTGQPVIRRFSVTQQYTILRDGSRFREIIAKTMRYGSTMRFSDAVLDPLSRRSADNEFAVHKSAYELFAKIDNNLAVPRPIDSIDDRATIVMENLVRGHSLSAAVSARYAYRRPYSQAVAIDGFGHAGRWLKTFHDQFQGNCLVPFSPGSSNAVLEKQANALLRDAVCAQQLNDLVSRVKKLQEEIAGHELSQGTLHGDFKPDHAIVQDKSLYVIDFGTSRQGTLATDIGSFLAGLQCVAFGPRVVGKRTLQEFETAFKLGYFGEPAVPHAVRLFTVLALMRFWKQRRKRFANGMLLRPCDQVIDTTGLRHLYNRHYVDKWFTRAILSHLGPDQA